MKPLALTIFAIICSLVVSGRTWSCDLDKSPLYATKFSDADPTWELPDEAKLGSDGLALEPPLNTISMGLYQGDFFDKAVVCVQVGLSRPSEGSAGGLIFWAKDYEHNYVFVVEPPKGAFYVGRRVGNRMAYPIVSKTSDAVKKGIDDVNELAITLDDGAAALFINGKKVGSITAQTWTEGNKVGIVAESTDKQKGLWRFKEFQVSRVPN
jgi:hypothetical protein